MVLFKSLFLLMAKNGFNYEPNEINNSQEKPEAMLKDILEKKLYKIFKLIQNGKAVKGNNVCGDLSFEYSSFPMDSVIYNNKKILFVRKPE